MRDAPPLAEANLEAALTLLTALIEGGVTAMVLCPGSRSAPLAQAAGLLEGPRLRLLTALDERSAAFWALGYGRASGHPAAVITTSGTAVANLLPAAVEADWGCVPLLLISADRPERLKNCGANQTVNQDAFLQSAVRWLGHGDPAGLAAMPAEALRRMAHTALRAASGDAVQAPGPVHLNLPIEEPLHSTLAQWQRLGSTVTPQQRPQTAAHAAVPAMDHGGARAAIPTLDPDLPGVVVAGPWRGMPQHWSASVSALVRWLARSGWPLLADGLSGLRGHQDLEALGGYDLVLAGPRPDLQTPQVLRLGPLPASRRLQHWLQQQRGRQLLISEGDPRPLDPLGCASVQWSGGLAAWIEHQDTALWQGAPPAANGDHRQRWRRADAAVQALLARALAPELSEPSLARALSRLLPSQVALMLANSSPVRDWESFSDPEASGRPVYGFRGASGIDGTLSSACGIAEALGQAVLLSGDLALLHDSNGLLWRQQLRGRLGVVLINNGGGGIFEQLPIRHAGGGMDFERLFAMPQSVDVGLLCAAHGLAHRRLTSADDLAAQLEWLLQQPLAVLEVCTDRISDAALRHRLRTMATELVAKP